MIASRFMKVVVYNVSALLEEVTVTTLFKGAGHDGSFVCINVGAHTVDVSP